MTPEQHDFSKPMRDQENWVEGCCKCGRLRVDIERWSIHECKDRVRLLTADEAWGGPVVIAGPMIFEARVSSAMWWPPVVDDETTTPEPAPVPPKRPTLGEQWIRDWGRAPLGSVK